MTLTLYELYQKMLSHMGPTNWWPADTKQQIIIEAILIQNTTELNATRASQLIKDATAYDLQKIIALSQEQLQELVRPAGFMKNKSKAIHTLAKWYVDHNEDSTSIAKKYGTKLRKILLSLHGVGPETADVLLTYVFDQPQFVSDKYARTLFTQLGVKDLTDYKSLSIKLSTLPNPFTFTDAQEFHGLIDEFGKKFFHPIEDFKKSFLAGEQLKLD
ncbi:endonuclease III domain-containing protein [Streptococcus equinus]|uniref:endonuclease III domain-containing protein n=1 Tax=Streptococcus equinus TaxID=1335 RepID=UPI003BF8F02F